MTGRRKGCYVFRWFIFPVCYCWWYSYLDFKVRRLVFPVRESFVRKVNRENNGKSRIWWTRRPRPPATRVSTCVAVDSWKNNHLVVPVDGDHVLCRIDWHLHRIAVWGSCWKLADAPWCSCQRMDRCLQYVCADLFQRISVPSILHYFFTLADLVPNILD